MSEQMQQASIVVLGATGKVGIQVLHALLGNPVRALSRSRSKFIALPGVEWVEGDIADEKVMMGLLTGVEKLFLNSGVTQRMVAEQCQVIDWARKAGVRYIIKLSTPAARKPSKDPVGEWHWDVQEHLKASGLLWNSLQPQSFMQNWLSDVAVTIKAEQKIYSAAGDGRRAFVDTRDIGSVTACLFRNAGNWVNQIIPLSGGELVNYYDVADAFSQALEKKVTYIPQSPEEAAARMRKLGVPEYRINIALIIEANQKLGLVEKLLTNHVEKITGKAPHSVYEFVRDYVEFFK